MRLTINHREVYLKEDTQITLVLNNSDFNSQDTYTFEIEIPYRDCKQNRLIFGNKYTIDHNHRQDYTAPLDAVLEATSLQSYHGKVFPIAYNEDCLTIQFIGGNTVKSNVSEELFDTVYVNRLKIEQDTTAATLTDARRAPVSIVQTIQFAYDSDRETYNLWANQQDKVFVGERPWVNQNTGTINNPFVNSDSGADYTGKTRSGCWSLLQMTQVILNKQKYTHDFYDWARSEKALLCGFNTLPQSWGLNNNVSRWLPNWTINEYLHQLELLLNCKFIIDHAASTVKYMRLEDYIDDAYSGTANTIVVPDKKVLKSFSAEIDDEEANTRASKVSLLRPYYFADRDDRQQKYEKAHVIIEYLKEYKSFRETTTTIVATGETVTSVQEVTPHYREFASLQALYNYCKNDFISRFSRPANATRLPEDLFGQLFYVQNVGYFCMRQVKAPTTPQSSVIGDLDTPEDAYNTLQRLWDISPEAPDNADECKIVPVCVDDVAEEKNGNEIWFQAPFLPVPEYNGDETYYWQDNADAPLMFRFEGDSAQPYVQFLLTNGLNQDVEFFDKIFVGFLCNEMDQKADFRPDFVNMSADERPPLAEFRPQAPMTDNFTFGLTNYDICDFLNHQFKVYTGEQPEYGNRTETKDIFAEGEMSLYKMNEAREDIFFDYFPRFNPRTEFTFYFISPTIPAPRKIFRIANNDYLCTSIEVTFNSRTGMNHIIKGTFYAI